MKKSDKLTLNIDSQAIGFIEDYVDKIFHRWSVNEIYMGNVVTSLSNLIFLLLDFQKGLQTQIIVSLDESEISFLFSSLPKPVLTLFLKEYNFQDILDNATQSVFLIQKIADNILVEKGQLIITFQIGALPDSINEFRKKSLSIHQKSLPKIR